jgi:hypothetical protein
MPRSRSSRGRVHIVLIPGFAGFDALGQLEYYAGVTPQFQQWKDSREGRRDDVALHYFDNFPTAAVRTRAARLRRYLTTRIARGEFAKNDPVALVGHSTGGLDIRWLLWKLNEDKKRPFPVDGATMSGQVLTATDILHRIKRVVFLSVPQWGTNIADWVRSYRLGRELIVAELRTSVGASQVPLLDRLQQWISNSAADATKLGLVLALRDALSEAEAGTSRDPMCVALSQEAASELQLWLRHIATDFRAIDDLAAGEASDDPQSPAHFNRHTRDEEIASWQADDIKARSYATVGARPFDFAADQPVAPWELLKPLTYPDLTPRAKPAPETDIAYRTFYRACAGGPFASVAPKNPPTPKPFLVPANFKVALQPWDNDGIVNTQSMLWPNGKETLLVRADHMDIVGHFRPVDSVSECGLRTLQAYDLLKSDSGFHRAAFARVWNDVFEFCVS